MTHQASWKRPLAGVLVILVCMLVPRASGVGRPMEVAHANAELVQQNPAARTGQATPPIPAALIRQLRAMGSQYPCAVLAMLQFLQGSQMERRAILYTDEIPSHEMLSTILDYAESAHPHDWPLTNPYSASEYLIAIEWHATVISDTAMLVHVEAQLVRRDGTALGFPHPVEPPCAVLITESGVRVLVRSSSDAATAGTVERGGRSEHGKPLTPQRSGAA